MGTGEQGAVRVTSEDAAEGRRARLAVPLGSALSVQLTNEGLPSRRRRKAER